MGYLSGFFGLLTVHHWLVGCACCTLSCPRYYVWPQAPRFKRSEQLARRQGDKSGARSRDLGASEAAAAVAAGGAANGGEAAVARSQGSHGGGLRAPLEGIAEDTAEAGAGAESGRGPLGDASAGVAQQAGPQSSNSVGTSDLTSGTGASDAVAQEFKGARGATPKRHATSWLVGLLRGGRMASGPRLAAAGEAPQAHRQGNLGSAFAGAPPLFAFPSLSKQAGSVLHLAGSESMPRQAAAGAAAAALAAAGTAAFTPSTAGQANAPDAASMAADASSNGLATPGVATVTAAATSSAAGAFGGVGDGGVQLSAGAPTATHSERSGTSVVRKQIAGSDMGAGAHGFGVAGDSGVALSLGVFESPRQQPHRMPPQQQQKQQHLTRPDLAKCDSHISLHAGEPELVHGNDVEGHYEQLLQQQQQHHHPQQQYPVPHHNHNHRQHAAHVIELSPTAPTLRDPAASQQLPPSTNGDVPLHDSNLPQSVFVAAARGPDAPFSRASGNMGVHGGSGYGAGAPSSSPAAAPDSADSHDPRVSPANRVSDPGTDPSHAPSSRLSSTPTRSWGSSAPSAPLTAAISTHVSTGSPGSSVPPTATTSTNITPTTSTTTTTAATGTSPWGLPTWLGRPGPRARLGSQKAPPSSTVSGLTSSGSEVYQSESQCGNHALSGHILLAAGKHYS